jgi:hypothetical protein
MKEVFVHHRTTIMDECTSEHVGILLQTISRRLSTQTQSTILCARRLTKGGC